MKRLLFALPLVAALIVLPGVSRAVMFPDEHLVLMEKPRYAWNASKDIPLWQERFWAMKREFVVDMRQTYGVGTIGKECQEMNPVLGRCPSRWRTTTYFTVVESGFWFIGERLGGGKYGWIPILLYDSARMVEYLQWRKNDEIDRVRILQKLGYDETVKSQFFIFGIGYTWRFEESRLP